MKKHKGVGDNILVIFMLAVKISTRDDFVQVSAFYSRTSFCLLVGHARRDGRDQPYGRICHIPYRQTVIFSL